MRKLKIFFHDSCFDGATSAALFAEFYEVAVSAGTDVEFEGVQHRVGDPFAGRDLDGDDNACVDFRYCPDPRMTWWFDHHVSGFQPAALRRHFDANPSPQKVFEPTVRSCALLIEQTLGERFEFRIRERGPDWSELIDWADRIDGAQFRSAREAVELADPALHLMTWLENNQDPAAGDHVIRLLGRRPLAEIVELDWISEPLVPILETHRSNIELIGRRATESDGVVFYDLTDDGVWAHNKFIAYMLFPESLYTVGLTRSAEQVKVSVGCNPWSPRQRRHNIAEICIGYGGGGHPVVGAVSLSAAELDRMREIAAEICDRLASIE